MGIPQDRGLDHTCSLFLKEGYCFISNRCTRYQTDIFTTRLMLKKAVCMLGQEAAEQFYFSGRFTRRGAMPRFVLSLIQDVGSVMTADGEDHRKRKEMFLSLMTPEALARLSDLTTFHWRGAVQRWKSMNRVSLFHEAHVPLCAAICEWSGLRLSASEVRERAEEFEAMVEGTGSFGARNLRGHHMRSKSELWMRQVIRAIRSGKLAVREATAADLISFFRDCNGLLLDVKSAAVELINVLRPTVAVARYIVFAAMALLENPEWQSRLAASDDDLEAFVNEVRRFYPFIPAIGGRVLTEFTWRNHNFRRGDWVLFDLYGTNHDPRLWDNPEEFRPERFRNRQPGPCDLVSHGAGDRRVTHRCPGEWMTVEQIKTIVRLMVRETSWNVPAQDLRIDLARIPAVPKSRFLITRVRERAEPLKLAS